MLPLFSCFALLSSCLAEPPGEALTLKAHWTESPVKKTRHTTFVASFNSEENNDADFATGLPLAGGFGIDPKVKGKHGNAVRIAETGGHLHFRGEGNLNPHRGTLRMLVRGKVWQDRTSRWLFESRSKSFMGIRRDPEALSLVFREGRFARDEVSTLKLPFGEVSADAWHSVVASWDWRAGEALIALDGRAVRGKIKFPGRHSRVMVFYVGGGFGARLGGMNEPGMEMDEFALYDLPLWVLDPASELGKEDEALLSEAEAGVRKCYNQIVALQRWGGWQTLYTWPTLIGSAAQGREWVDFEEVVGNDKSAATPRIAARLLYSYEVLGDYRFFEAALKTGEFLLAAQDKELGFWLHGYEMTVAGIRPATTRRHIKLQDSVQSHPIFFLSYLHRLTGDDRYLEALKKAGEFYLTAQNPNGSWSHHFDAEKGIGLTARGQPQGGEINDLTMNDAIDVMALMYHITDDVKYVAAMKRAGEWLLRAQLKGTVGWAEQYDKDDRPVRARHFEPPAYSSSATRSASRALVELYRFSGDERFLAAVRKAVEWVEGKAEDGLYWCYYDPASGRPIAGWQGKTYFMDDADQRNWIRKQPIGIWQTKPYYRLSSMQQFLGKAAPPKPEDLVPDVTKKAAAERMASYRPRARYALDTRHKSGLWVVPKVSNFMGSIGAGFGAFSPRTLMLLQYIESARIVKGELEPGPRPIGTLLRLAYPKADWYAVGWGKDG
ncbi:MAG: pectate lyase [Planctomycetota bacterium]|nr:pectate lyase [Planctomycetota bacterium]